MKTLLSYQAESAEEFRELLLWTRQEGFDVAPKLSEPEKPSSPAARGKRGGPKEEEYKERSGLSHLRYTKEEKVRVYAREITREGVAQERLDALEGDSGVAEEEPPPEDDGEETY